MMCDIGRWVEIRAQHFGSLFFAFNHIPHGFAGLLKTRFAGILISKQESFVFEVLDDFRGGLGIAVWACCQ